jgi:hypothetical protein
MIVSQHPTKALAAVDHGFAATNFFPRIDNPVLQRLVIAFFVMMDQEFANGIWHTAFVSERKTAPKTLRGSRSLGWQFWLSCTQGACRSPSAKLSETSAMVPSAPAAL